MNSLILCKSPTDMKIDRSDGLYVGRRWCGMVYLFVVGSVEISKGDDVWRWSWFVEVLLQFRACNHCEGSAYFFLLFPWLEFLGLESKFLVQWWDVLSLLISSLCVDSVNILSLSLLLHRFGSILTLGCSCPDSYLIDLVGFGSSLTFAYIEREVCIFLCLRFSISLLWFGFKNNK